MFACGIRGLFHVGDSIFFNSYDIKLSYMTNRKQNVTVDLANADRWLFISGIISVSLFLAYLNKTVIGDDVPYLLLEGAFCLVILFIYYFTFRNRGANYKLLNLARVISVLSIIALVLTTIFIIYFVATFRW